MTAVDYLIRLSIKVAILLAMASAAFAQTPDATTKTTLPRAMAYQFQFRGGRPADALPAMQKGPAALDRALQLNPNHAEAMATRGGVQAFMDMFQKGPAGAAEGIAKMNRAIELSPTSRRVRLQRADLHAETGAGDLARAQYELVAKSASPASAEAALRLWDRDPHVH